MVGIGGTSRGNRSWSVLGGFPAVLQEEKTLFFWGVSMLNREIVHFFRQLRALLRDESLFPDCFLGTVAIIFGWWFLHSNGSPAWVHRPYPWLLSSALLPANVWGALFLANGFFAVLSSLERWYRILIVCHLAAAFLWAELAVLFFQAQWPTPLSYLIPLFLVATFLRLIQLPNRD